MKNKYADMRYVLLIVLFVFLNTVIYAQNIEDRRVFVLTGIGGTSYRGDLSQSYESWGGTFHAGILFNKKKRINGSIHLMAGGVRGNNPSYVYESTVQTTPNKYFKTSLFSVGYELRINIIKKELYALYFSPGISILRYNPKDQFNDSYSNQFTTRAKGEEYSNITIMLPVRIGVAYHLPNGYGIGMDVGFLNPMTDYIDNISHWGNRKKKDNLMQLNILLYVPLNLKHKE
jgi:hypothetical protein